MTILKYTSHYYVNHRYPLIDRATVTRTPTPTRPSRNEEQLRESPDVQACDTLECPICDHQAVRSVGQTTRCSRADRWAVPLRPRLYPPDDCHNGGGCHQEATAGAAANAIA